MTKIIFESFVDTFKTNKTGVSFYDQILDPKDSEYMKFMKGVVGHIEKMTAHQYIQILADEVFGCSYDKVRNGLSQDKIDKYADMMKSGTKFNLPYINLHSYFGPSQEGRHRMIAMAQAFGEDAEGSVLVVEPYEPVDEEIEDYAKRKYGKDVEFGISYINGCLDKYLERNQEDRQEEVENVKEVYGIDLDKGDIIDVGDGWARIDRYDLDDPKGLNINATLIDSGRQVNYFILDNDTVKVLKSGQ